MFLSVALPLAALSFFLLLKVSKSMDFALDRAAIALTGDPQAYISAIQRAEHCVPQGHFPRWFKPEPVCARVAVIIREFAGLVDGGPKCPIDLRAYRRNSLAVALTASGQIRRLACESLHSDHGGERYMSLRS
jgi:hypothetical protein